MLTAFLTYSAGVFTDYAWCVGEWNTGISWGKEGWRRRSLWSTGDEVREEKGDHTSFSDRELEMRLLGLELEEQKERCESAFGLLVAGEGTETKQWVRDGQLEGEDLIHRSWCLVTAWPWCQERNNHSAPSWSSAAVIVSVKRFLAFYSRYKIEGHPPTSSLALSFLPLSFPGLSEQFP